MDTISVHSDLYRDLRFIVFFTITWSLFKAPCPQGCYRLHRCKFDFGSPLQPYRGSGKCILSGPSFELSVCLDLSYPDPY